MALLVGVEAREDPLPGRNVDLSAKIRSYFSDGHLPAVLKDVGHRHQLDVLGHVEAVGGRSGPPPACSNQRHAELFLSGGVDAAGDTQSRSPSGRYGKRTRATKKLTTAGLL